MQKRTGFVVSKKKKNHLNQFYPDCKAYHGHQAIFPFCSHSFIPELLTK